MKIPSKDELEKLIAVGEGFSLEFKRTAAHLGREICAFANSGGGRILIGVDDAGTIVGIGNLNRVKSEVQNVARSMEPSLLLGMDVVEGVLVVSVPSGADKPYSANGKFYLREAATCQQMSRAEIREFFFKEGLIQFDRQPCFAFSMNADMDARKYREFSGAASLPAGLRRANVLRNLQLVDDGKMANAGVLLFSKDVSRFFLQASVVCVLFQGTGKSKVLDKKVFSDGVAADFKDAMGWLQAHLNTEYIIGAGARVEKLELPEEALREALLNAIAHRDYRLSDHVQINVFQDRVEFINPGGLVAGLKRSDLGRVSRPRNTLLFSLLERMTLVENIGSGIKRMRDAMKECNLAVPKIELGETWYSISFPREELEPESGPESIRERILSALLKETLGRSQLAKALGHKGVSGKLKMRIEELLSEGVIEYTVPDKPTSRLQKYRLVKKEARPGPESGPESIRERILSALLEETLSRSQLATALGHKGVSGKLKLRIKELLSQGFIEMTIPEKPTSRLQKYRLVKSERDYE